jgi:hypothetical protein
VIKYMFIAALVLAGCKKKHEEAPAPAPVETGSGSAAATTPPPAPPPTAAAGSAVDVPTEQDFEEQAKADIDDKNVAKKLDSLEGDLAQ